MPSAADAAALASALDDGARLLDCPLSATQRDTLLAYLALLGRWNRVYNLSGVKEPAQMLKQHLLDSLAAIAPLRRVVGTSAARLLDVGSGGGLPGIVLAVLMPSLAVICVDAVDKKAAFIRQAAGELGLSNVTAEHARVETLSATPFDVITARAFSSLADLVTLTRWHLRSNGVWMAMKAHVPDDEIAALASDIEVFHVEPIQVPSLDAARCLVWMRLRQA